MAESPIPVVFIHGLWLHATSWQPWVDLFREEGYDPVAPGWPGEPATVAEAREHPELVAGKKLAEVIDHFRTIVSGFDRDPIIIGHSFGGLITEVLMGEGLGTAGVAIDPAQIKGVLPLPLAQLKAGLPALGNPANINKAISLTDKEFKFGFGNELSEEESAELHEKWTIPSPVHALFEVAAANFNPNAASKVDVDNSARGPLLLVSGTKDHTAPDVTTEAAYKLYRHSAAVTTIEKFEGRGHSLALDHGWRQVADEVLAWLNHEGL
ncbi:MAG TPA: alpha/beta hydrolase [Galbitalea sp.]|jgi:pimeloyl-ACP methyl ester carboxylesterase